MTSPKEYRQFAQECMRAAEETNDEEQRQLFLDMAKQWMQAALQVERSIALIDDDTPLPPKPQWH